MALVIHYKNFGNILQMGNSSWVTHHFLCAEVTEDVSISETQRQRFIEAIQQQLYFSIPTWVHGITYIILNQNKGYN